MRLGLGLGFGFRAQPAGGATAPANTGLPIISGTAQSGQTLSTTDGSWDDGGAAISGYTYQWKADGVAISGATGSTFEITDTQIGAVITVTVTATNAAGSTEATSEGTDPVERDVASYRYLRINISKNVGSLRSRVFEAKWAESSGGAGVTSGGTASADTVAGSLVAANAFDGDSTTTAWASTTTAMPHWLKYDMGAGNSAEPVEVRLVCKSAATVVGECPEDFTIEGSNDDATWTVLKTVTGQTGWTNGEERTFSW